MITIKIDHDVETKGEAIDYLRHIALEINKGYVAGEGWEVSFAEAQDEEEDQTEDGDGQIPANLPPESSETTQDDKTPAEGQNTPPASPQDASEDAEYEFTKDWSDRKAGDVIKASELGDGAIFTDLTQNGTIVPVSRETDGSRKPQPWWKR